MNKNIFKSSIYSIVILLFTNCSDNKEEFENKLTKARECLNKTFQNQKDFDGAIVFYTHAITIDSSKSIAFYERGMAYDQKGEQLRNNSKRLSSFTVSELRPYYLKALSDLNKAIYLDPINPNYYEARAHFYSNSHHFNLQKSIADLDKVLQLNPKDYDVLLSLGSLKFWDLKDSSSAFLDFKEAIEIDPKNYRAYQDWGECLYKCGSYSEAIIKYRMCVKLKPLADDGDASYAFLCLARAQLKLGDYFGVIANCERIREYSPDCNETFEMSAEAKIKLGFIDAGKNELLQGRKQGHSSDLYFEYFGTKKEKEERKKYWHSFFDSFPNGLKKWPLWSNHDNHNFE